MQPKRVKTTTILKNLTVYKVCCECEKINLNQNLLCYNCEGDRFKPISDNRIRIMKKAIKAIGDRLRRVN